MKRSCLLAIFLVSAGIPILWGRDDCTRISTEVTFNFSIENPLTDPNQMIAVDSYHTDLELSFRPTGWEVVVSHDCPGCGATGLDLPPDEALLMGNSNGRWVFASIPAGFEFIGAKPNEPFWILPQNAGSGALPLGVAVEQADSGRLCSWNPGDVRGADSEDRWVELRLLEVRGPADANFAMWQADGINPPVVFMSTHYGGITEDDVYYISDGSHVHMNWGFTKAGLYEVDFQVVTVIHCDESIIADWAPVGDEFFNGDCKVDFRDFAHLAAHWLQLPNPSDPHTRMFVDPNDPDDLIDTDDLKLLTDQWLQCGYPGCQPIDVNSVDPNELIMN